LRGDAGDRNEAVWFEEASEKSFLNMFLLGVGAGLASR